MTLRLCFLRRALWVGLLLAPWACSSGDDTSRDTGAAENDAAIPNDDGSVEAGSDAGAAEDSNAALCEELGMSGACEGGVLRFCAFGELKERDCVAEFSALGLEGGCAFLSDSWGFDCTLAAGQPCLDQAGNSGVCDGAASGCFMGTDDRYSCRADVGGCDPDVAPPKKCEGPLLIEFCEVTGQLFGIDCAAFEGRCDEALGACVDLAQGASCDGVKRRCADGMTCRAEICAQ